MSLANSAPGFDTDPGALNERALAAARSGDPALARTLLERACQIDPTAIAPRLNLAGACRALGDVTAAVAALDEVLKRDPRNFPALLMHAVILDRQGETRNAGAAYALALTQAPPETQLDAATLKIVERAREAAAAHTQALATFLRAAIGEPAEHSGRRPSKAALFIDRIAGRRKVYHQEPAQFNYPGLPSIEFYDRDLFPWIDAIEAAAEDIIAEFKEVFADRDVEGSFSPYVAYPDGVPLDQWAKLNRSDRWSAYHLMKGGSAVADHVSRCPRTMAALSRVPQPDTEGRSPASMFSLLLPKTRIPPHTGVSNNRLVVHLPLVVPDHCGFRVGSQTRGWSVGEAFVFDDTIEHEAWNDSDSWRSVLIFDVWHPALSENDRQIIREVMRAIDVFNGHAPGDSL